MLPRASFSAFLFPLNIATSSAYAKICVLFVPILCTSSHVQNSDDKCNLWKSVAQRLRTVLRVGPNCIGFNCIFSRRVQTDSVPENLLLLFILVVNASRRTKSIKWTILVYCGYILVYGAVRCSGNALDLRSQSHIEARPRSGQEALSTCIGVSTTLAITFKARRSRTLFFF